MTCEEAKFGLYALLDDELDVAKDLEVLGHVEGCPACQRELDLDRRLKSLVRQSLTACHPSPELSRKVALRIEVEAKGERHAEEAFGGLWLRLGLLKTGLVALAALILLSASFLLTYKGDELPPLEERLVQDHLRAMTKAGGSVDLPSDDPAKIVESLRVKMPSASTVPYLIQEGTKLVGGSICQLGETKGIRFTYQIGPRPGRIVSFYQLERLPRATFPRLGTARLYIGQVQGPGILLWGDARFLYAFVGELPAEELQGLASHMGSI